jgi:bifunctional DNase/RNase
MNGNEDDVKLMHLEGVRIELSSQKPIVLLREEKGNRYLPIWIGVFEATAIALEMAGVKTPRPMTHDLISSILRKMGIAAHKVVVDDLIDNTFYATILLKHRGREYQISSRPSDAIAIAVREKIPIFVSESVLEAASIVIQSLEEEVQKFRDFLDSVEPEDFNK